MQLEWLELLGCSGALRKRWYRWLGHLVVQAADAQSDDTFLVESAVSCQKRVDWVSQQQLIPGPAPLQ